MEKLRDLLRQPAFHTLLFCFSFAALVWPLLGMFHLKPPGTVFSYLFLSWAILIVFLFLISRSCRASSRGDSQDRP
jgi:hypothetical protein